MPSSTTNLGFQLPDIGGDSFTWGSFLNANWEFLDEYLNPGGASCPFLPTIGGTITGSLSLSQAGNPYIYFINTSLAADEKQWAVTINSNSFLIRANDDNGDFAGQVRLFRVGNEITRIIVAKSATVDLMDVTENTATIAGIDLVSVVADLADAISRIEALEAA